MAAAHPTSPQSIALDAPLTPKIRNKRKDTFDCQQLQLSLKRVRLSNTISPGELRLQRDLRSAVTHSQWIALSEDQWRLYRKDNISVFIHRDPQDLMKLTLKIRWDDTVATLHLHVPRLYPHRPPQVRRLDYSHADRWVAGKNNHYRNVCSGGVRRIVIACSPDSAMAAVATASPGTVIWRDWSPVSRFADVIDWLIDTVASSGRYQMDNAPGYCGNNNRVGYDSSMILPAFRSDEMDDTTEKSSVIFEDSRLFPPNRFDVGYHRDFRASALELMDFEMEV